MTILNDFDENKIDLISLAKCQNKHLAEVLCDLIKTSARHQTREESFKLLVDAEILDENGFYSEKWFTKETIDKDKGIFKEKKLNNFDKYVKVESYIRKGTYFVVKIDKRVREKYTLWEIVCKIDKNHGIYYELNNRVYKPDLEVIMHGGVGYVINLNSKYNKIIEFGSAYNKEGDEYYMGIDNIEDAQCIIDDANEIYNYLENYK